jgi:serine/threonine-protein kinase
MGQVYRAKDTRLKRDIALKILPDTFGGDPDRVARFQREAELLATLNHPNIAAIYGFEHADGMRALVLELVDGPTLADRIAQGPIPIDEALLIARQIADALEAAHEKGVIHRDLKPANIKLTPDDRVKVLDFGLAKAFDPTPASNAAIANSPTLSMQATFAGVILGTAAYMSPEQARGSAVDKRADIWAFGVVLFELVVGRRLFDGPTVSDTLADVLRTPIDFDALPQNTPRPIRELLQRCLDRNASTRLRDIGEARVAIDKYLANPAATAEPVVQTISLAARARTWPWIATAALAVIALAAATYVAYRTAAGVVVERPLQRFTDRLETGLSGGAEGPAVALSPDGERLAYVTADAARNVHVAVRRLEDATAVVLAGTEGGAAPTFSPDGRWIAFFAGSTLKKVAVAGGAAATICSLPAGAGVPRGGIFWADDATVLFAGQRSPVLRVSSDGGTPSPITRLDEKNGEVSHRAAQLLPGGALLFETSIDNNEWENATIDVQSPKGGEHNVLVTGGYFGRYIHGDNPLSGHLLYMRGDLLFAAPMDAAHLALTGPALPVLEDVAGRSGNGLAQFAFTSSGTFVYVPAEKQGASSLFWLDRAGGPQVIQTSQDFFPSARISPDGSRIAIRLRAAPADTLGIYEWATGRMTRLPGLEGIANLAEWAPDGTHLVVPLTSRAHGGPGIYWARADGAGEPVRILDGPNFVPSSFSPDGTRLLYGIANAAEPAIWTVPLDLTDPEHPKPGKPERFVTLKGSFVGDATFSPDGRWIAYQSSESGRGEVYVRPFPTAASKWQVSTDGGLRPVWSRDGRELFYLQPGTTNRLTGRVSLMAVPYSTSGDAFTPGQPRAWSASPFPGSRFGSRPDFDVAPDGKRVIGVMPSEGATSGESPGVTFLLNFADELRRKVPSK